MQIWQPSRPYAAPGNLGALVRPLLASALMVAATGALTLSVLYFIGKTATAPALALLFLVPVAISAYRFTLGTALLTLVLSVLCWDFLYGAPYYSLSMDDPRDVFALATFVVVAFVIIGLTARMRRQKDHLAAEATTLSASFGFSQALQRLATADALANFIAANIREKFSCDAIVLLGETARDRLVVPYDAGLNDDERAAADALIAGSAAIAEDGRHVLLPLDGHRGRIGAVVLPRSGYAQISLVGLQQLRAMLAQASVAIERANLADKIGAHKIGKMA